MTTDSKAESRTLRLYRWLFPYRMTQRRLATRVTWAFIGYVVWIVGAIGIGLVTGPDGALVRILPALTLAFLPVPATLIAVSSVLHRQYRADVAQWREDALQLAVTAAATQDGKPDDQRATARQVQQQAAALDASSDGLIHDKAVVDTVRGVLKEVRRYDAAALNRPYPPSVRPGRIEDAAAGDRKKIMGRSLNACREHARQLAEQAEALRPE